MVTTSKKRVSKTSIFELPGVKNCMNRLCTNPLGDPLYIPWMVILDGHNIKKTGFENFDPPRTYYPNGVKNT